MNKPLCRALCVALALSLMMDPVSASGLSALTQATHPLSTVQQNAAQEFESQALTCVVVFTLHVLLAHALEGRQLVIHQILAISPFFILTNRDKSDPWQDFTEYLRGIYPDDVAKAHALNRVDHSLREVARDVRNVIEIAQHIQDHQELATLQAISLARQIGLIANWVSHHHGIRWSVLPPAFQEQLISAMLDPKKAPLVLVASLPTLLPLLSEIPSTPYQAWAWRQVGLYLAEAARDQPYPHRVEKRLGNLPQPLYLIANRMGRISRAVLDPHTAQKLGYSLMPDLQQLEHAFRVITLQWGAPPFSVLAEPVQDALHVYRASPYPQEKQFAIRFIQLFSEIPPSFDLQPPRLYDLPRLATLSLEADAPDFSVESTPDAENAHYLLAHIHSTPELMEMLSQENPPLNELAVMPPGLQEISVETEESGIRTLYLPLNEIPVASADDYAGEAERLVRKALDTIHYRPTKSGGTYLMMAGSGIYELITLIQYFGIAKALSIVGGLGLTGGLLSLWVYRASLREAWRWWQVRNALLKNVVAVYDLDPSLQYIAAHLESLVDQINRIVKLFEAPVAFDDLGIALNALVKQRNKLPIPWWVLPRKTRVVLESAFHHLGRTADSLEPYLLRVFKVFKGIPPGAVRRWGWGQMGRLMRIPEERRSEFRDSRLPDDLREAALLINNLSQSLKNPRNGLHWDSDLKDLHDWVKKHRKTWGKIPTVILDEHDYAFLQMQAQAKTTQGRTLQKRLSETFEVVDKTEWWDNGWGSSGEGTPEGKPRTKPTLRLVIPKKHSNGSQYSLAFAALAGIVLVAGIGIAYSGTVAITVASGMIVGVAAHWPTTHHNIFSINNLTRLYYELIHHVAPERAYPPIPSSRKPGFLMAKTLADGGKQHIHFKRDQVIVSLEKNGVKSTLTFSPSLSALRITYPSGAPAAFFSYPRSNPFRGFAVDPLNRLYILVDDDFLSYFEKVAGQDMRLRELPVQGLISPREFARRFTMVSPLEGSDLMSASPATIANISLPSLEQNTLIADLPLPAHAEAFLDYLDQASNLWPHLPETLRIVIGLAHSPEFPHVIYEHGESAHLWLTLTIPITMIPEDPGQFPELMKQIVNDAPDESKFYLTPQQPLARRPTPISSDRREQGWRQVARGLATDSVEILPSLPDALWAPAKKLAELVRQIDDDVDASWMEGTLTPVWEELERWVLNNQVSWGRIPFWVLPENVQNALQLYSRGDSQPARDLRKSLLMIFDFNEENGGGWGPRSGTPGTGLSAQGAFHVPRMSPAHHSGSIHRIRVLLTSA